jgi:hypothetical protein
LCEWAADGGAKVRKEIHKWTESVTYWVKDDSWIAGILSGGWALETHHWEVQSDFSMPAIVTTVKEFHFLLEGPGQPSPSNPSGRQSETLQFWMVNVQSAQVLPTYELIRGDQNGVSGKICVKRLFIKQRCKKCCSGKTEHAMGTFVWDVPGLTFIGDFGELLCDSSKAEKRISQEIAKPTFSICNWKGVELEGRSYVGRDSRGPIYGLRWNWPENSIEWVPGRHDTKNTFAKAPKNEGPEDRPPRRR